MGHAMMHEHPEMARLIGDMGVEDQRSQRAVVICACQERAPDVGSRTV